MIVKTHNFLIKQIVHFIKLHFHCSIETIITVFMINNTFPQWIILVIDEKYNLKLQEMPIVLSDFINVKLYIILS